MVQLKEVYAAINAQSKDSFEIVYVTSDKTPEEFQSFIKDMPWYAIPYEERRKFKLLRTTKVEGQ